MNTSRLEAYLIKLIYFTTFIILTLAIFYAYQLADKFVAGIKVSEVKIRADLKNLDIQDVYEVINNYLDQSFYSIKLTEIKSKLEQLPWISNASINRSWPTVLDLIIEENKPLAYLSNGSILSDRKEIFYPNKLKHKLKIPKFIAAEEFVDEIVDKYYLFSSKLQPEGFTITEFELMPDGGFRTLLDDNINLYLGSYELNDRLDNFTIAFRYKLKDKANKISYVDLRYTNGVAVGWK